MIAISNSELELDNYSIPANTSTKLSVSLFTAVTQGHAHSSTHRMRHSACNRNHSKMARRNTQSLVTQTLQLPVVALRVRAHLLSRSEDAVKRYFVPTVFGQVPRSTFYPHYRDFYHRVRKRWDWQGSILCSCPRVLSRCPIFRQEACCVLCYVLK